jgi:cell wall-associated NlpC family hydrolase
MLLMSIHSRPPHRTLPRLAAAACAALTLVAAFLLTTAPARAVSLGTWNLPEQHEVRLAGLMHDLPDAAFHGERPLAGDELPQALAALAQTLDLPAVGAPASTVSVATFDRLLVAQLGATATAQQVQHAAWAAGLDPPPAFGTEVVARALGLRDNHPAGEERFELYPTDAITRAEAAHSLAIALRWKGTAAQWAQDYFTNFVLPVYTAAQKQVLRLAVAKIGMPYIWGGETDTASSYYGGQVHGGYDCSGFVWRVFKLGQLSWGAQLHGRTAAQQAAEIPRSQRIRLDDVQPADLVFFGPGRFWQKATERRIVHEGLALSPDWMIHSSGQGVYVSQLRLDPWRAHRFSWARRLLP